MHGFIHQAADAYIDQLQSCRPEILYPQLVHDTPKNRNPEKYRPTEQRSNLA